MSIKRIIMGTVLASVLVLGNVVSIFAEDYTQDVKFDLDNGQKIEIQAIEHNYLGTIEVNMPVILEDSLDKTQYKKEKVDVIRRTNINDPIATYKLIKGKEQADYADGIISYFPYNDGTDEEVVSDYEANLLDIHKTCKGYSKMKTIGKEWEKINSIDVVTAAYQSDLMIDVYVQYYKNGKPSFYLQSGKILMLSDESINEFLKTGKIEMYEQDTETWKPLRELLLKQTGKTDKGNARATNTNNNATKTASNIMVNSKKVDIETYTINNSTYFKLRDLAYIVNGTEKQFDVKWDSDKKAINLLTNTAYEVQGNEMSLGGKATEEATISNSDIYINGTKVELTAYNIAGNTYFKLRDLAEKLNFNTKWSAENKSISISTSEDYVEE